MHVRDGLAKTRPGLPTVQHQVDVRQALKHLLHRSENRFTTAFGPSRREPEFERRSHGARYFESRPRRAHQILERPGGAKHADAQRAAGEWLVLPMRMAVQEMEIGQIRAART